MADRSVLVRLRAQVTDFRAGMAAAGQSVDQLQTKLADGDAKTKANAREVSRGMLLIGAAAVTGAGLAVKAFAGFDKEMSNVKAVSNATAGEMDQLRDAAIDAGKATVFSASESAKAEAELAKAGVSTADILGGALTGSLNLASSGQLELADAATIAAQAMNIFKLQGRDVSHIADVLAAGANKSAADVKGLGDALRQGGLSAAQADIGLEETVGTLSAFADNALIGSDAGTALKTMIASLIPTSEKAAGAMEDIGLHAYDAQGNFIGLEAVAGQLQRGLGTLSAEERNNALQTIFGNDAKRAAAVLYEEGAAGIRDYTDAVNDNGAAARMAATQLDNLAGDVEQLKGSLETALIGAGSGANGSLRQLTQGATGAVNAFSDLPGPVQSSATGILAVGGAALIALGGVGTMIPKVQEGRDALRGLGTAGSFADRNLGRLGRLGAIGAVIATVGVSISFLSNEIIKMQGHAPPAVNDLTASLLDLADSGKITGAGIRGLGADASTLTDDLDQLNSVTGEVNKWAGRTSFGLFGRDFKEAEGRVDALDQALTSLVQQGAAEQAAEVFGVLAAQVKAGGGSVKELRAALPGYADALKSADVQARAAGDSTSDFADAADQVSPAVEEATDAVDAYKEALDNLNGVNISAARAQLQLGESYRDANKAKEKGKKVTDDETSALLDLADQANDTASAVLDQTGSQKQANDVLREARQRFYDTARAMGYSKEEAAKLRDAWLQIPTKRKTDYTTSGVDQAQTDLARLRTTILGIPTHRSVSVTVGTVNRTANIPIDGKRAAGGWTPPGTYLVGEHGPELFATATAGNVIPAGPTAAVMAGASMSAASSYSGGGSGAGAGQLMRDLIVYTQQQGVEDVIPRVLDSQMYRMRG